jgi:hypothetical protein
MSVDMRCRCPVLERLNELTGTAVECGRLATAEDGLCDGCRDCGHGADPKTCVPSADLHVWTIDAEGHLPALCTCGTRNSPEQARELRFAPGWSIVMTRSAGHRFPEMQP